jgi:hypothetical protein
VGAAAERAAGTANGFGAARLAAGTAVVRVVGL